MKKVGLWLAAALLCCSVCASALADTPTLQLMPSDAQAEDVMPEAVYAGVAQRNIIIREEPSVDAPSLGSYQQDARVLILSYDLEWLKVVKGNSQKWVVGYVQRHRVDEVVSLKKGVLPYGATPTKYTAVIARDTLLRDSPDARGEPLFTLTEGSKLAILEIENGWAKVIYWRQYAYFYLDAAVSLTPVYDTRFAQSGDVIAAFVSFYNLSEDGLNPNRMVNIRQACEYISIVLDAGKKFEFDSIAGPYRTGRGYLEGVSFFEGRAVPSVGGGVCQVSSTLYNVLLALPDGMQILYRRAHGPSGATYLPHGVDAAVGGETLNLIFKNTFDFPVRIEASAQDGALFIAMVKE